MLKRPFDITAQGDRRAGHKITLCQYPKPRGFVLLPKITMEQSVLVKNNP
jgi:hypothetical protein